MLLGIVFVEHFIFIPYRLGNVFESLRMVKSAMVGICMT
jgi:hypothetical protein